MNLYRSVLLAIVVSLSACTTPIFHSVVGKVVIDGTIRSPKNVSDVEVLLEVPTRGFRDIVLVEISDEGTGMGIESIKKAFAVEAAKLGGDAVIVSRKKDFYISGEDGKPPIGSPSSGNKNNYEGRVIVYTTNP